MPLCAFWRCRAGSRALESDARPAERHRQAPHFRQGRADFSGRRSGEWHLRPRQRLAERLLPARVWRGLHGAPRRRRLLDRRTRAGVRQAPARVRARGRTHRDGASFRAGPHEIAARRPAPLCRFLCAAYENVGLALRLVSNLAIASSDKRLADRLIMEADSRGNGDGWISLSSRNWPNCSPSPCRRFSAACADSSMPDFWSAVMAACAWSIALLLRSFAPIKAVNVKEDGHEWPGREIAVRRTQAGPNRAADFRWL